MPILRFAQDVEVPARRLERWSPYPTEREPCDPRTWRVDGAPADGHDAAARFSRLGIRYCWNEGMVGFGIWDGGALVA